MHFHEKSPKKMKKKKSKQTEHLHSQYTIYTTTTPQSCHNSLFICTDVHKSIEKKIKVQLEISEAMPIIWNERMPYHLHKLKLLADDVLCSSHPRSIHIIVEEKQPPKTDSSYPYIEYRLKHTDTHRDRFRNLSFRIHEYV